VKGTGYPLHSPVSPSLPLPCVTVCHQVSTALLSRQATWPSVHVSHRELSFDPLPCVLHHTNSSEFRAKKFRDFIFLLLSSTNLVWFESRQFFGIILTSYACLHLLSVCLAFIDRVAKTNPIFKKLLSGLLFRLYSLLGLLWSIASLDTFSSVCDSLTDFFF